MGRAARAAAGGPAAADAAARVARARAASRRTTRYFIDVYQTHDQPPATQVVDATNGKVVAQLAKSDMTKYTQLGFKKAEQFTFKAADGKTTLYGQLSFPSNFDPSKKYPTLLSVYGGPASGSNVPTENFAGPSATPSTAS